MKRIPAALAAPWAIEPGWLRVVYSVWSRGELDAKALEQAQADWRARQASKPKAEEVGAPVEGTGGTLTIVGHVGVISIEGPLFRHATLFSDISGGTSYDAIWKGLEAALNSTAVRGILLRVNSPGGEADGVNELAHAIAAAAKKKPVWAYAEGMMASAAYWLGSQALRIVAEETSEVGSIGVRCGLVDYSKADEMAGVREIEIISSVSPGKRSQPVDDDVIGRLQTRCDDLADVFVGAVAAGRGVDAQVVLEGFGRGDVLIASKAHAAGMVDEIGNFNSTLGALTAASLRDSLAPAPTKESSMPNKNPLAAGAEAEAKAIHCAECKQPMHSDADHYCKACYEDAEPDGDEDEDDPERDALAGAGLLGAKRSETRANLITFAKQALKACGVAKADEALGNIRRGAEARTELEQLRAQAVTAEREKAKATVLRGIKSAVLGGTVKLGKVVGICDFLDDDEAAAKVRTSLEAAGSIDEALAAFEGVTFSTKESRRISSYLGVQDDDMPTTRREPEDTDENRSRVQDDPTFKRAARAAGAGGDAKSGVFSIAAMRAAATTKEQIR